MLCDQCKTHQATVHKSIQVNGNSQEMHLCSYCYEQEKNMTPSFDSWTMPFFSDLFKEIYAEPMAKSKPSLNNEKRKEKICSTCGMDFSTFQQQGRLGCVACYDCFGQYLPDLLKRLHGKTEHVGKIPHQSQSQQVQPIEVLRQQLDQALAQEDYEKACRLRDEIKSFANEQRRDWDES